MDAVHLGLIIAIIDEHPSIFWPLYNSDIQFKKFWIEIEPWALIRIEPFYK